MAITQVSILESTTSFSNCSKGYGYHGDFQNGWNVEILQLAINSCTDSSGLINKCSVFSLQSPSEASTCTLPLPATLAADNCIGPRIGLCGNVTT